MFAAHPHGKPADAFVFLKEKHIVMRKPRIRDHHTFDPQSAVIVCRLYHNIPLADGIHTVHKTVSRRKLQISPIPKTGICAFSHIGGKVRHQIFC